MNTKEYEKIPLQCKAKQKILSDISRDKSRQTYTPRNTQQQKRRYNDLLTIFINPYYNRNKTKSTAIITSIRESKKQQQIKERTPK